MKNFKVIRMALLCLLTCSLFMFACGDDSSTPEPEVYTLIGEWKMTKMTLEIEGETVVMTEEQINAGGVILTYKFEEDGTAEEISNLNDSLETRQGIWTESGNELTLTLTSSDGTTTGTTVYNYSLVVNKLTLDSTDPLLGMKIIVEFRRQ